ncbi:MAG: hypothetical protein IJL78_06825 [Lachnospiraceae bacterium]|nr:hypothetical protein [Lachnospiraceae bacterium]
MRFPNAQKGVSRIYKAEIIMLISSILTFVSGIIMIASASIAEENETAAVIATITMIITLIAMIVMLVAFILNLTGVISAKKDEGSFRAALYCILAGLVFSALASIFSTKDISDVFSIISRAASICVTLFIIQGISNLAARLKDSVMVEKGNKIMYIIVAVQVLSLITTIVSTIFQSKGGMIAGGVIIIIASVLDIVAYFMYLTYLAKARRMLEN